MLTTLRTDSSPPRVLRMGGCKYPDRNADTLIHNLNGLLILTPYLGLDDLLGRL